MNPAQTLIGDKSFFQNPVAQAKIEQVYFEDKALYDQLKGVV